MSRSWLLHANRTLPFCCSQVFAAGHYDSIEPIFIMLAFKMNDIFGDFDARKLAFFFFSLSSEVACNRFMQSKCLHFTPGIESGC